MKVEIWSDVVCPWCYVGKRHFEEALSRFDHADQVEVEWRSFELDPDAPARVGVPMSRILERKYGMTAEQAEAANERMTALAAELGLEYHLDDVQAGNTFDAHRLIHLAARHGLGDAMKERLFAAYFTEGLAGRRPRHVGRAGRRGRARPRRGRDRPATAIDFAVEVRDDEARAAALGVSGVPFFVIDEAYGDLRGPAGRRPARRPGAGLVGVAPRRPGRCPGGTGRRSGRWRLAVCRRCRHPVPAWWRLRRSGQHPVGAGGRQGGHQAPLVDHLGRRNSSQSGCSPRASRYISTSSSTTGSSGAAATGDSATSPSSTT